MTLLDQQRRLKEKKREVKPTHCLIKNCVRPADGVDDVPLCAVHRKGSVICTRR